jgi:hypothetical protein
VGLVVAVDRSPLVELEILRLYHPLKETMAEHLPDQVLLTMGPEAVVEPVLLAVKDSARLVVMAVTERLRQSLGLQSLMLAVALVLHTQAALPVLVVLVVAETPVAQVMEPQAL